MIFYFFSPFSRFLREVFEISNQVLLKGAMDSDELMNNEKDETTPPSTGVHSTQNSSQNSDDEEGEDLTVSNKFAIDDDEDSEEEDDDDEELTEADKKFIADEEEENKKKKKKKRKRETFDEEDEDDLDDEDLQLLNENYGISNERKWKKLRKKASDTHTSQNRPASTLENLFSDDEDDEILADPTSSDHPNEITKSRKDFFQMEQDDSDELDAFIVDDEEEGNASDNEADRKAKKEARRQQRSKLSSRIGDLSGVTDETWRDILDIFGDGSEYAWALTQGVDNIDLARSHHEDEDEDEEGGYEKKRKPQVAKDIKLSDIYEPAEIKKKLLTEEDELIRIKDIPERFQLRGIFQDTSAEALQVQTAYISKLLRKRLQNTQIPIDSPKLDLEYLTPFVHKTLKFIMVDHFEIPYIHEQKKDYVGECLDRSDLWFIYDTIWLCQNVQSKKQQILNLVDGLDAITAKDLEYFKESLNNSDALEEVESVYTCLKLKYGAAVRKHEEEKLKESTHSTQVKMFKKPVRKNLYEEAKDLGLAAMARKFNIDVGSFVMAFVTRTPDAHFPEDMGVLPSEAAQEFISPRFPTTDLVLAASRQIIAEEIAADPKLKGFIRNVYQSDAVITVTPTARGITEINPQHPYYSFKYLKDKPSFKFTGGQFLQILAAEEEGLVNVNATIDAEEDFRSDVMKCIVNDYESDIATAWNKEREEIMNIALNSLLFPSVIKWLKETLREKSAERVVESCVKSLMEDIDMAPFQFQNRDRTPRGGPSVLALSWGDGERTSPAFGAILDAQGTLVDHFKLEHLQEVRGDALKKADLNVLSEYISQYRIELICISGWSPSTKTKLFHEIRTLVDDIQKNLDYPCDVQLIDDSAAKIFMGSKRASVEFPNAFPGNDMIKYCVSLGRRVLDPTMEFAGLVNTDDEISVLNLHPLQKFVAKDVMKSAVERCFVNVVNYCGVDINNAVRYTHKSHTLQFVCGLGPRKAQTILAKITRSGGMLESRANLINNGICGSQIFLNCSSFLRVRKEHFLSRRRYDDQLWDVLDDTRIHPENYDLARKMASDAIEIEEQLDEQDNPSLHVQELMEGELARLDMLLLDDYAKELERSLGEPKRIILNEIKAELNDPYRERRRRFAPITTDKLFTMLTNETDETLYKNILVTCRVTYLMDRSVKVVLNNGLEGMIGSKYLSDASDYSRTPQELGFFRDQILTCRVVDIYKEKMSVELSARPSDIAAVGENGFSVHKKDQYFCEAWEESDKKESKDALKKVRAAGKRTVNHPDYRDVDYRQAEEMMKDKRPGYYIIRPSTKGHNHLSITWKVANKIFQHIDVLIEGQKYFVGNLQYSELDELCIMYVEAMARYVKDIVSLKAPKFQSCTLEEMRRTISASTDTQRKSAYGFILCPEKPGSFYFVYQHVGSTSRPKSEIVLVRPNGFVFREKTYKRVEDLVNGFKKMEQEKARQHKAAPAPGFVAHPQQQHHLPAHRYPPQQQAGSRSTYR